MGAALVMAATQAHELDPRSLWGQLVGDYLRSEPKILRGEHAIERLTEREYAGLWLTSWGERAIAHLDTVPSIERKYPGLRKLLELALSERGGAA